MAAETLKAVPGFDLRSGVSEAASQCFHQSLGCSKPLVAPDGAVHVVLNEHMASGGVRNHFVKASLDLSLANGWSGGGGAGGGTSSAGRVRSWCSMGTRPVRAIQGLDDACGTLVYAQGGLFRFAAGPRESDNAGAADALAAGGPPGAAGVGAGPGAGMVGVLNEGGGASRGGGGGGGGDGGAGVVFESVPVHSGSIVDFQVNPLSRDVVSGCDHGHVHVLNFSLDMVGVPSMKVSKYVGQPLSSVRWGLGAPYVASWTSSRGLLQMLDTRSYQVVSSIQVEGQLPVHTHEHLSDVILAVGCGVGCVQLFDVRKMDSFVTLQDPVAGRIHQIIPSATSPSGVGDWVAFGTGGVSRYTVGGSSNGSAGAAVGVSPDDGVLARAAAGVSYAAGCRTVDLNLSAGLDVNAGLFLAPSPSGASHRLQQQQQQQKLCGITLDSRIVVFSTSAPGRGNGGVSVNAAKVSAPKGTSGTDASVEPASRTRSSVAPACGTKVGGGGADGSGGDSGGGSGQSGGGEGSGGGSASAARKGVDRDAGGGDKGSSNGSGGGGGGGGGSAGEASKEGDTAAAGPGKEGSSVAVAGGEARSGTQSGISK